jgi:hypothetical protein
VEGESTSGLPPLVSREQASGCLTDGCCNAHPTSPGN